MLSTLEAANVLSSGGLRLVFTTASPTSSTVVSSVVATTSGSFPTSAIFTTISVAILRLSRPSRGIVIGSSSLIPVNIPSISKEDKGKGIMTEHDQPSKEKVLEQMSIQLARELEEEFAQEEQIIREQAERDSEIAKIHTEKELDMMIAELDRSNEMVAKHMSEYEQAEADLSLEEKIELITKLIKYQRDLAQIKKYQAQQSKLATKTERRKFYISVLKNNAVLVRKEVSVDVAPVAVKTPLCDWKIFKDKIRDVYQIFKVGQAPKAYPYFDTMLKEFDWEDVMTLYKLVKDIFKTELPKSDLEKCLYWPLKVMFEPVASDALWKCQAPIKYWKMYSSCRVHCLSMEGMIIYMLDNVESDQEAIGCLEASSLVSENFPLLMFPLLKGFSIVEVFPLLAKDKDYSCAEENKVTFATGTLTNNALSWWNAYAQPMGIEQANQITWTKLKRLLTNKYYPRTEIRKMEEELYNLIVKGNDLKPYVRRFQELTVLCPNMVPNNDKLLEAFIGGLPRSIEGNVTASKPQTLEEAINIAQRLMDQVTKHAPIQVSSDNKRKFDDKRTFNNSSRSNNNYRNTNNRIKGRAYVITSSENSRYARDLPLCKRCIYHHTGPCTGRCNNCNRMGHLSKNYRSKKLATRSNQLPVTVVCHACGEKGHYTNQCQKTNINAQGRAYMLRDKNAQQDPNVVTGMFLLNQHLVRVLFDSGADRSFISLSLASMLNIPSITVDTFYNIEMADGNL
ncbi:reverse transcriptase domain-containing protein, partial [Tanacetum coccineum]